MSVEEQEASLIFGFSSITDLRAVMARSGGIAGVRSVLPFCSSSLS